MTFLLAIFIGAVSGFASAFFGIGGSSLETPLLRTVLGLSPFLALGTPLPAVFFSALAALAVYRKRELIDFRVLALTLAGAMPAMLFGSVFSDHFSGLFLMIVSASVLFGIGLWLFWQGFFPEKRIHSRSEQIKRMSVHRVVLLGGVAGLASGILANGGGLFLVPMFVLLLGLEIHKAIATSLLAVLLLSLPGAIVHFGMGHIRADLSVAIGLGAVPFAYLGAKMDLKTSSRTLRQLLGLLLVLFSLYFFFSQISF